MRSLVFTLIVVLGCLFFHSAYGEYSTGLVVPKDWEDRAQYLDFEYSADLPSHFDWREKLGKEPVILNQGNCGSCWAFSRVMSLSWQYLLQGKVVTPAPQELVSCDRQEAGCGGGFWDDYEISSGISEEAEFPYQARNVRCKSSLSHAHKIAKWLYIGGRNRKPSTEELKQAIFQYGPVGVTVSANGSFSAYKNGVYGKNGCNHGQTNHMVVLTGWDEKETAWFLQNSWGMNWGNKGYMQIKYGCNSVAETAAVPLLQ